MSVLQRTNKERMIEMFWLVGGNLALAVGVALFVLPNDVLSGGLAGIAIAIEPLVHLDPQLVINGGTLLLFVVGALFLGKAFALKTIVSSILYPMFVTLLTTFVDTSQFVMDPYLATIYGGVFMGVGVGCVFRTGASTGGVDIPPLIIHKYTHVPVSTLVMIVDALTVLLGVYTYGIEAALRGILCVWVSSFMINKAMLFGGQNAKRVEIISKHYKEMMQEVHEQLSRGTTIYEAKGGFSQAEKPVLMVIVDKKEYAKLQHIVMHIDPEAFVIVSDTMEVHGLGFTFDDEI